MDLGIRDRRALVLGASRGLGEAIAKGLASEGVRVIAAARSLDRIEAWAERLNGIEPVALDMADPAAIDRLADRLEAEGGIDILVNNGGGPPPGSAQDARRDDWITHFETMAANLFHLTDRFLPNMKDRGWGRIVTIASSGVEQPIPNLALSNGVRSAVVGWSKTLANEVANSGVTVNVVLPGRIHTARVDELDAAAASRTGKSIDEVARTAEAAIPIGRYGRPEEFADVVTFLASERASYITGSRIRVDGGAIRSV